MYTQSIPTVFIYLIIADPYTCMLSRIIYELYVSYSAVSFYAVALKLSKIRFDLIVNVMSYSNTNGQQSREAYAYTQNVPCASKFDGH